MSKRAHFTSLSVTLLAMGWVASADAHHSFASYDMTRTVTVQAIVKEFRWSAPHSSVVITVALPNGESSELNLVTGSPETFARQGFVPKSLRAGDKVEASYHPNVNGSAGGALASLTLPNGRTFKDQESFGASPSPSPSPPPPSPNR